MENDFIMVIVSKRLKEENMVKQQYANEFQ